MPRPALDHYVGHMVVSVVEDKEDDSWSIRMDDGTVIRNHDPNRPIPAIAGMLLYHVIMSELETRLLFGPGEPQPSTAEVTLSPRKYSISAPDYEGSVYPQVAEEHAGLPRDPSPERVHPAPTTIGPVGEGVDEPEDDSEATDA